MANIFTGILDLDNVPPAISDAFPAPSSSNASHATSISFKVTDVGAGVDLTSVDVTVSSIPAIVNGSFGPGFSGTISPITDGYSITITPDSDIGYGKSVVVDVYAQDLAGIFNFISSSWSFSTEVDSTPPHLDNFLPAVDALNVATSSSVSVDITDPESGIDSSTIDLIISGVTAISGGEIQPGFLGSIAGIPDGYTLTVTPAAPFDPYSIISLSLTVENSIGLVTVFDWSFFTADENAPIINVLSPAPGSIDIPQGASIQFTATDEADVDGYSLNVSISGISAVLAGVIQPGFSGTIDKTYETTYTQIAATLTPDLPFGSYEHVVVDMSISDTSENNSTLSWEFRTVDSEGPIITNPLPADGSTNVPSNSVAFVQVIDLGVGVDISSIDVSVRGESAIIGGVYQLGYLGSIDPIPGGYEVHVHPQANYDSFHVIPITISAADLAGNASVLSWSFRIIDDQLPTVSNLQPPSGSTGVPVDSQISFEARDLASGIDTASIDVSIDGVSAVLAGSIQSGFSGSISTIPDGYAIAIIPDASFLGSTTVLVTASVSDVAGNNTTVDWSFDTAILISYIMRAYREISQEYVYWSAGAPDPGAESAPYPAEELSDIVIANVVDGGQQTYNMRAYYSVEQQFVYWTVDGQPDPVGEFAPVPAVDLSDITVASSWSQA